MRARLLRAALLLLPMLAACAPQVIPAGPPIAAAALRGDVLVAADGARLPMRSWLPADGAPWAVVLGLHGFGDYARAFEQPGAAWAAAGIATYAYDQRGFGQAPGRYRWAGVPTMVDDLDQAVSVLRARHPGLPLYLAGESMGGAIAMAALAGTDPPPVDGAILIGPAVRGRETIGAVGRAGLWFFAHTIPWWPVSTVGMDYQPSDNRRMLEALSRDPLVIKSPRVDQVWGLADAMDAGLAAAPRLAVPTLLLYGLNDRLVPPEVMQEMVRRLPLRDDIRIALYPKGYHMLLRDLQAPVVHGDVLAWMRDHAAPLPSAADRLPEAWLALRPGGAVPDTAGRETATPAPALPGPATLPPAPSPSAPSVSAPSVSAPGS